jgi:hypothetical protein
MLSSFMTDTVKIRCNRIVQRMINFLALLSMPDSILIINIDKLFIVEFLHEQNDRKVIIK